MDNLSGAGIIQQTAPEGAGMPQVYLEKSKFDTLIWQKGYDVYHDKSIKCPCRNKPESQAQSSCRNCGGSGWVFINRTETKMVLQSINIDTKFKDWSAERLGTCKISVLNKERITFMDRITLKTGESVYNENLFFFQTAENTWLSKTTYDILDVTDVFAFEGTDLPLKLLKIDEDYVIEQGNWIKLISVAEGIEVPSISIRYTHRPVYHIIDLTRGIMSTPSIDEDGKEKSVELPVAGVARLAHYIIDQQGYSEEGSQYLHDNSYQESCDVELQPQCNP